MLTKIIIFFLSCISISCLATDLVNINKFRPLTADKYAVAVGDAITLLVFEDAKAGSSANQSDGGEFDMSLGARRDGLNWGYGLGASSSNQGEAATQRAGFIKAHITVQVTAATDQGLFSVEGSQKLRINGEEQVISVSGRLRKEDIAANNTALSSRLLDANISFTGQGSVTSGKDSGVVSRFLRWIGVLQ